MFKKKMKPFETCGVYLTMFLTNLNFNIMKKLTFKTLLLTVIVSGAVFTTNAQSFEKGKINIGACSDFQFTSVKPAFDGAESTSYMDLDLSGGYFVIDNLLVKAELGFSKAGEGDAVFGFGAGARYYIMDMIFAEAMYRMPAEDFSSIGLGVGYVKMLNDHVSIEPMIVYDMDRFDGEAFANSFGFKLGLGIYF